MALSFTPSFSACIRDNCKLLVITPDYSDYPDFYDLSALTLELIMKSESLTVNLDMLADIKSYGTGTISLTLGSRTVSGASTEFSDELQAGDYLVAYDDSGVIYQVDEIASDTSLTITTDAASNVTTSDFLIFKKEFYIYPTDLGYSDVEGIPDDIYHFTYELTFDAPTSSHGTYEYKKALDCHRECYIFNKIREIPNYVLSHECNCDYVDEVTKAWMFLMALRAHAQVGGEDEYVTIAQGLDQLIDFDKFDHSGCGC